MLTAELDNHLGYDPYERTDSANARNGKKQKTLCSKYGEIPIEVPQEREGSFEPQIVKKRDKRIFQVSMVVALIKDEADAAIADEIKDKNLKSMYQANRNFILGQVFNRIINLLVNAKLTRKILEIILEKSKKIRSQIRPNRSRERKNKHPRKKHHHNKKSCI